jgi:hypothetical protein
VSGRIERLSLAALRMAASARSHDVATVAQWLYHFGTVPRGPAIDRDFGPDDDPLAVLGMTMGAATRRALEAAFEATSLVGWYSFARTGAAVQMAPSCKLYVSPRPEALADAFPRIVREFVRSDLRSFKIGRGIEGLLRPDKIVAYFDDAAQMAVVASALEQTLRGCPAQGAPFTSDIGGDGLLSLGVDPPPGQQAASWRSWVTRQLAESLVSHSALATATRVTAVLEDMHSRGVDSHRWLPSATSFAA